jgi:hypothetical protein
MKKKQGFWSRAMETVADVGDLFMQLWELFR